MQPSLRISIKTFLLLFLSVKIEYSNCAVNQKLTSVYYGNQGWAMNQIQNFTSWSGKRPAVIVLFTDWCNTSMTNLFNIQLNNIWKNGSIPLITWEPFGCGGSNQPGIMKSVNNGSYDAYLSLFGDRLKSWLSGSDKVYGNNDDRRVYIRLAHEMNGNWYPWSLNSTPAEYVSAWQRIYTMMKQKGLDSTRIQWIWCVNNADVGPHTAENYWVGDAYIDWLGIDGYNFGSSQTWSTWQWPEQVFDNMIQRLRVLSSKPVSINEYASTSKKTGSISDVAAKLDWLNRFCNYTSLKQIKMASYFNTDKETDWAIFGGNLGDSLWNGLNTYSSYRTCLQTSDWVSSDASNIRLITDQQFSGQGL